VDPSLVELLCCPETLQPLRAATAEELEIANRVATVSEPLDKGLVRQDGAVLYSCREGIPTLLAGEGISLR
jgi:uncharacterized protein YbaR (Trm112 family)